MLKSKKFWGFLASIFFLWLALRKVDWQAVPAILSKLDFSLVLLMFLTYTLEYIARGYRWRAILPGKGLKIRHACFGIVLCYFFNNLLPARAGEFIRAFYLKKKNAVSASEAFGSVVFERFLDGVIIITFIVFSLNYFPATPLIRKASISAVVFYSLVLVAILLLQFQRRLFEKLTRRLFSLFPENISKRLADSRESFINGLGLIARPKLFFRSILLSAICWALSTLTIYICLQMFKVGLGLPETILLISVLSIGSMLPASPGMIGVYEFCCVITLNGILGYSEEIAATFGLVSHSIGYIYSLLAGFIVLTVEGLSFSDLSSHKYEK